MKVINRLKSVDLQKSINLKPFGFLWYAKETAWTVAFWILLFGCFIVLPQRMGIFILTFAGLLISVWIRAVCTKDTSLAEMTKPRLLRHAVLIAMLALVLAWILERAIL